MLAEQPPSAISGDRHGRASIRIALRQLKAAGQSRRHLQSWLANFDPAGLEDGDDEADLHHDG